MLQIRVVSVAGQAPATPIAAQFGPAGGTIGRNEGNTLVLPDDAKTISRQHAAIQMQGQRYVLMDKGANPTIRNNAPVGAGQVAILAAGDELRIGPYVLTVELPAAARAFDPNSTQVSAPAAPPGPAFDPFALPPAPAPAAAQPAASSHDPFADLFGGSPAAPAGAAPVDPFAGLGAPVPPAPARPSAAAIPDDFDPFASLAKPAAPTPAQAPGFNPLASAARRVPPPISFDPKAGHDDLISPVGEKSASIDELFGLGNAPANPLDVLGAVEPVQPGGRQPVDDPLALFGGPPATQGAGAAQADHTPAEKAVIPLPAAVAPVSPPARPAPLPPAAAQPAPAPARGVSAQQIDDLLASVGPIDPNKATTGSFKAAKPVQVAPTPPPAAPAAPADAASVDALMAAFCEGLGSPLNLPDGVTEEFMYRMGGLVREAVQGTVDLLNARAVTKREVKASATMIMERNNNPLKFSPDAKTAMLYLVSGRLNPAFMPPITAMRDAYYDLRSHQFGFMAGTKAALEGVLERFEPQRLEGRLAGKGLVESLIPAARKARLWDLFNELYKEIAREAEDDFHALFGQAFLKAYEEHVEALRRDMPEE
ncbi:type VI secretion system-associated FHA domain protein TagH [Schlegelella sp. S2-27]|uniref:Type VI secretion system-associated FHA domain protein TagH n=1 Tax=Caldimonas mangrovi TaxID=2944811 RepID=A0ABT0YQA0_9BURK|nr:type VI secretion system-associated FHA domain protein TagH [Caldimonas mangrovi]MCM5680920.1 type VI secretion system-associated FHA domain protein TagH [Caldimonas mangrovi]